MYDTLDQEVSADCQRQLINNSRTQYMWEVSVNDGVTFQVLNTSSTFTSPYSRELPTVYLDPALHVRCRVQAMDSEGRGSYWRVSDTVKVNRTRYKCSSLQGLNEHMPHKASLTSYDYFRALEQVRVSIEEESILCRIGVLILRVCVCVRAFIPRLSWSVMGPIVCSGEVRKACVCVCVCVCVPSSLPARNTFFSKNKSACTKG